MSETLKLRCRCGWEGSFSRDQQGLVIPCPACERELLVTDDAAAFAVRNVGAPEFELDLGDPAPEPTDNAVKAPTGASRGSKAGGRRASRKRPQRYDKRLPAYAQFDSQRARPIVTRQGQGKAPVIIGAIVFLVVLAGVYVTMSRAGRESALKDARSFAAKVAESLGEGRFSEAQASFSNVTEFQEVMFAVRALFPNDAPVKLAFAREREYEPGTNESESEDYSAVFHAPLGTTGYRLFLRLTPHSDQWRISKASFRELTPGEQP